MSTEAEVKPPEESSDLGLGSRVVQGATQRFLNRDGTFNVSRHGLPLYRTLNPYHALVTISWPRFYGILLTAYIIVNLLFALGYLACGPAALQGVAAKSGIDRFWTAFFFSVQTVATIGYGKITPEGLAANTLVALEALVGLLGFTLAAGLAFARFSQPQAKILFSQNAVIAPYRGITGFMFRIANERDKQLIQVRAQIVLSRWEYENGARARKFHFLALERESVMFFPLHWVIVHPIDDKSPLAGLSAKALIESDAEFLILLTGYDETSFQTVHARSSYKAEEVVVGARFTDIFVRGERIGVDLRRISDIERVPAFEEKRSVLPPLSGSV